MQVKVEHITKIFGKLHANDDVSMTFEGGRIYAVLGENGAGKSTLMKILSGYQPPDGGTITLDGSRVSFQTPADALRFGIGMLHQDPLDVASLTVLENFMFGRSDRPKAARAVLESVSQSLGFQLQAEAYIDSLTIGERQQLEIVRLLSLGARLLILDEPTTGISAAQKDILFRSLKQLAADRGLGVILVSHKLEDVEALCDQVYVLRAGKVTGERTMPCSTAELVALMFGGSIERGSPMTHTPGEPVLTVKQLCIPGRRLVVEHIDVDVRAGEVIGLAGLDGSGQVEFLQACAGLQRPSTGAMRLTGQDITHADYHAVGRLGVAYAPAGRLEEGLIAGLTLTEHFALVGERTTWVNWKGAAQQAQASITHFNIRGRPESAIQTLSGGNQQRTLLALLPGQLRLLLLENPTRGLDVESAAWMWRQLLARRESGTAILFVSPDLDEIIEYSDRVMVFFGGRVTLVDDPAHKTVDQLGQLIGGKALS
ncbi:MAG TPA: ATP-binding cassette domain-containing protein [Aggregatilineales bacterium]|nr:ATP-binding cassette domain-containing protein [Aggregatilineales bacterium]